MPEIIVTWRTLRGTLGERIAPDCATAVRWMSEIGYRCDWVDLHDAETGECVGQHFGPPSWVRNPEYATKARAVEKSLDGLAPGN